MEFLRNNLWEIKKSSALQLFGGLLALAHLLTYIYWLQHGSLPLAYHADPNPMCWNHSETCHWVKVLTPQIMGVIFHGFGICSALAVALFFFTRLVSLSWFLTLLILLSKTILYVQDLRLAGNYHYLLGLLTFCFLLIPNKVNLLRYVFISYFMASGLLKMSPNWLTGSWFVDQIHVPIKLAEWLAAICVLVEMLAPVALLFRDLRNFLLGFFAMIAYLILIGYSSSVYEPLGLLSILMFFPLVYWEESKTEREYLYRSYIRPEPSRVWLVIILGVFWSSQALLYLPREVIPALKNLEQTLAMSPVSTSQECESTTLVVYDDHLEEVDVKPPADRAASFNCNPFLRYLDLKKLCAQKRSTEKFRTIMSYLRVRGLRDSEFKVAFQVKDFCSDQLTFRQIAGDP